MRCSKCGSENPSLARFCGECGDPFTFRCPRCGAENTAPFKFCHDCGIALVEEVRMVAGFRWASKTEPGHIEATAGDGERRHLTALFCDLVNSTEISARLDPEDWRDIAADYQRSSAEEVTRLGGHVAKYLGDGLVVYFGYPEAHEDDGERAVRAGLAIVGAVAALNERIVGKHDVKLSVRVGIHAGSVVVGQGGGGEADVFGDAPNIASRVQAVAGPNSVFITSAVHELVSGLFVVEDRGAQPLKGIAEPVRLFRVIEASGARGRFKVAAARGLTPLIGRAEELRLLATRWEMAAEGHGQLVLISGEAGIGKSRLIEEFRRRLVGQPHIWIESGASPLHENTPFYAVTEMIRNGQRPSGTQSGNPLTAVKRALELAGLKIAEALPLIADILELPVLERYPPAALTAEEKRKSLLRVLVEWAFGLARVQSSIFIFEDLHWADPSTLELVQLLGEQGAMERLLLICTARPEFKAPWPMLTYHSQIALHGLSDRQSREMVMQVSSTAVLSEKAVDLVVKRTSGVPLFVEELTRSVVESGGRDAADDIPATLHDSLMARLDRLGTAKEVAQLGAVIGNEFSYELVRSMSAASESELQRALSILVQADLLYAQGIPPEVNYSFRHALIRDAAYNALLKSRRRELHNRAARVLSERFETLVDVHPEILARHWTAAAESDKAFDAWQKAGSAFAVRAAFTEAERSFKEALGLLKELPDSTDRDAREFSIQSSLSDVLQITRGYSAPETLEATSRASALSRKSDGASQLIAQMGIEWTALSSSGKYLAARELADKILELALRERLPTNLAYAFMIKMTTHYRVGELIEAEQYFTRGLEFFRVPDFKMRAGAVPQTLGNASRNAWFIGQTDAARGRIDDALTVTNRSNSPYDIAFAQYMAAILFVLLRDYEDAEAQATQSIALSDKYGFPQFAAISRIALGRARASLGNAPEGIELIRGGLQAMAQTGSRVAITMYLTWQAETEALNGHFDDALETIERALSANPEERFYLPETIRARGELLLSKNDARLAEINFREAISVSKKMGARSFELRAAMNLARVFAGRGDHNSACALVSPLIESLAERRITRDVRDAKFLLDQWKLAP